MLSILKFFHGYLLKYLTMICRGHIPVWGSQIPRGGKRQINPDVLPFISYFLPKGVPPTRVEMLRVCRHFHLAFKGMEAAEVYDVLTEQLLRAMEQYDPDYILKVQQITGIIDAKLDKRNDFSAAEVGNHLDFDCHRHLRMLCKRGFLATVQEAWRKRLWFPLHRGTGLIPRATRERAADRRIPH